MSDFGVSMPSWWVGGNPNAGFQANLAQNQAAMANNQNFFNNNANIAAQNQASLNNAYGPGGFGGDTARYAAIGAAYGRGTGGFGGLGAANADPFTPVGGGGAGGGGGESPSRVPIASSPFDTGNAGAVPYLSGGGMPFGGGGFGRMPTVFDTGANAIPNMTGGGAPFGGGGFGGPMPQPPNFDQTFAQFGMRGRQMQNQPALDAVQQFNGVGTGVSPFEVPPSGNPFGAGGFTPQSDMATLPMAGFGSRMRGAGPSAMAGASPQPPAIDNSFAGRFGDWGHGADTPSEYYTGNQYGGPSQMPPGFQTPFGADNPGGALTRQMRAGTPAPVMNEDWDPSDSADTLRPGDRTSPGGFYGGAFDPAQFQPGGGGAGMGSVAAFNTYGLPGGGGMGAFGGRGGLTSGMGSIGAAPGDMSDFVSPSNDYNTFQRGASYPWTQQVPGNDPNIMNAVYGAAGRVGVDPAALANVIDTESRWNPRTSTGSYFGATQMGPKSFKEAGGRLGGMDWGQYQQAPLEQQIGAYPDWLAHYARPGNAAGLASGGISNLPVPMQSAIMQGTQFGPNSTGWPAAFAQGNTSLSTSPNNPRTGSPFSQAEFLGVPPTLSSMSSYFGRR